MVEATIAHYLGSGEQASRFRDHLRACSRLTSRNPFVIPAMDLFDTHPDLYRWLQDWPRFRELLHSAAQRAVRGVVGDQGGPAGDLSVRLERVPGTAFARGSVSLLRVADLGRFVRIVGTVTRAGPAKVVQEWRDFRCEQCGGTFRRRASPYSGYDFDVPKECPSGEKRTAWDPKIKRPRTTKCHSRAFVPVPHGEDCMSDFQEVRVQDLMQAVGAGVMPQAISVVLFGDLVGTIQPGDSVLVEGTVWQRWKSSWQGKRQEVETILEATSVERLSSDSPVHVVSTDLEPSRQDEFESFWAGHASDVWQGRSHIIRSAAPWLSGLPVPKLALLLTLIGGVAGSANQGRGADGAQDRRWDRFLGSTAGPAAASNAGAAAAEPGAAPVGPGPGPEAGGHGRMTPHLLLLGDPGTGKSQLLQAALELTGRGVRTSGLGCTSAGLTCAAVREGPDFVLEAGALVLADGGVCCIDEFSTIRSHDKAAVHEAMEQQTISVAKAGLVCRLRSQCSVVAAQNCKGAGASSRRGARYDCSESLAVNSGLPPPLLSRFDLVVVFADQGKGAASEADKADFIIKAASGKSGDGAEADLTAAQCPEERARASGAWGHKKLRDYLTWARQNTLEGGIDARAELVLEAYFGKLRAGAREGLSVCAGSITIRTLESLLRLSQAHARLMRHRRVQLEDAVAVVVLRQAALQNHVVGADMPDTQGDGPTLLDTSDEASAFGVRLSLLSADLHHNTDIPDHATYKQWQGLVLEYLRLQLTPDGRVEKILALPPHVSPAGGPAPIADRSPRPSGGFGSGGANNNFSPPQEQASSTHRVASTPVARTRGRALGWRAR